MSPSIRVASFNVNGIRARLPLLVDWLERERPHVVGLQETKVRDEDFPRAPLEELGYRLALRGQKAFNGVAVLSLLPMEVLQTGLQDEDPSDEARLILVEFCGIQLLNTYVPQGTDPTSERFYYKICWLRRLRSFMERTLDPHGLVLWIGDFNVAPGAEDVYDPQGLLGQIGFHPAEHRALEEVRRWGWVDVFRRHVRGGGHYTFWDYRIRHAVDRGLGWRVDHIWATEPLARRSLRAWIDVSLRRAPRPSDHTPVLAEFHVG
jgi:exodeoxyribonuclease-3